MSLVTLANFHAPAVTEPQMPVYQLVEQRIHDVAKPMPQPPNPMLDAADMAVMDQWIASGAPAGTQTGSCSAQSDAGPDATLPDGAPPPPADSGLPDTGSDAPPPPPPPPPCTNPDVHLTPASPWAMPTTTDDIYVCYGVDVTFPTKHHAVYFSPHIDNPAILHHMLLFQSTTSMSGTPTSCNGIASSLGWSIAYVWAPGGAALNLPAAAGFPMEGTTHFVVQVHYNNVNHLAGEMDSSGIDVCTTDQLRPNDAATVAFGTTQINVPAHATLDETCSYTIPSGYSNLQAFAAFPHMHQIGTLIETTDIPGGTGAPENLGSQPDWSFQSQEWFNINATINAGDVIKTRCAWSNPGDTPVTFGEDTSNEMCFSFTMYYPAASWSSWITPAAASTCVPTP